jgi:hypothetical protein
MTPETEKKNETAEPKEPKFISKLNIKAMGCNPGARPEDGSPLVLGTIYGRATSLKTGEDKRSGNMWSALQGSFEGVNAATGDIYKSGLLFLPGGIHEIIENAVNALEKDKPGVGVDFALEIHSVKPRSGSHTYSYQAVNLYKPTATDELEGLRQGLHARAQKLLEASKAPEAKVESAKSEAAKKGGK